MDRHLPVDQNLRALDRELRADPDDHVAQQRLSENRRRALEESVGPYLILEELRHPLPYTLYRARSLDRNEPVLLRLQPINSRSSIEAFLRRLGELRALNRPELLPFLDFGLAGQRLFLVSEHNPPPLLSELLAEGPLPIPKALRIIERLARLVEIGHQAELCCAEIHSPIYAGSIRIDAEDRPRTSAFVPEAPNPLQPLIGNNDPEAIQAISPEQIQPGPVGPRADLFGLGALLYRCLTGRHPFEGPSPARVMLGILRNELTPASSHLPAIEPAIDRLLSRALARCPEDRHPSAAAFADDLSRIRRERRPAS